MSVGSYSVPYAFSDDTTIFPEQVNADFTALLAAVNSLQTQINEGVAAGVASLNGVTGPVTMVSPDGSVTIGGSGQAITLEVPEVTFAGYPTYYNASAAPFNMSPGAPAATNTAGLQAAVNAAKATSGGVILIPAGIYNMAGTITITGSGAPGNVFGGLIIQGSSGGTELIQTTAVNMFNVTSVGQTGPNNAGVRFRDLWIGYGSGGTSGTAINCTSGGASVTAEFCYFNNCPQAFVAGVGGGALSCGLIGCTLQNTSRNNTSQITFSSPQCFALYCVIRQTPRFAQGGPTGATGITMQGTEGTYIAHCHSSDFDTGIAVTNGCLSTFIHDNEIQANITGILVQPPGNTGTIYNTQIHNNYIVQTNNSPGPGTNGVFIDSNGGTATNVQGTYLSANMIVGWSDAGVQIGVASQTSIIGGMIAGNGQNTTSTAVGAGVACFGASDSTTVRGVALIGNFNFLSGITQPYAAAISGGATEVEFNGCDMVGNTNSLPVYTNGTITHWYVQNCRGYNKSNFVVANESNPPSNATQFDATTIGPTPYLGDYLIAWTGATITHIKVSHDRSSLSAQDLGAIPSGTISLKPPQSIEFDFTGSFTTFKVLGN